MLEIGAVQFFHDPMVVGTSTSRNVEDPRDRVAIEDRALAPHPDPLPATVLSRGRAISPKLADGLVLAFRGERTHSPHMISVMSRDDFIADAWDVVGRKVSKERLLSDIYATQRLGRWDFPFTRTLMRCACSALFLQKGRAWCGSVIQIEARAVELLSDLPDYQLLTTIPGIGPINAHDHPGRSR